MQVRDDIERLLHPRGVAIVGPLDRDARPESVLAPLRERFPAGFSLVDAAGGRLGDQPIHSSIADVAGPVDVAVLNVRAAEAATCADECGRRGVGFLLVTAGFAELGTPGRQAEAELLAVVRRHGMRLVGPNASTNLYEPMPAPVTERIRKIGLITQSGHMGRVIFQSSAHGVAFSRWVPTGDEADIEASDFIEYFAYDDDTAVIAAYIEGFRDGSKLRKALAAAADRDKPVVLIKVGRHQAASQMAETHTAHLTGADEVVDGLFKQYGVVRVDDVDELIETAALYAKLGREPAGPGVALYGISGGAVALMADQAEGHGVSVPPLGEATQRRLHELLPAHLGVGNPVDPGNLYRTGGAEARRQVLETIGRDPAVGVLVCALTGVIKGITDDFVDDIVRFRDLGLKTVVTTWNTWEMDTPAYTALVRSGIPVFRSFRGCFRALHGLFERRRRRGLTSGRAAGAPPEWTAPLATGRRLLGPEELAPMLARHGIPYEEERPVADAAEAAEMAIQAGFPVVLKAHLPNLAHKSDAGLVLVDLRTPEAVAGAFDQLRERVRALAPEHAAGPLHLQRQVPEGVEMLAGMTRDPSLGPALAVGLGGIHAEVIRDVSVRPLPLTREDAQEMLGELRGHALLRGARGRPPADVDALVELLLRLAALAGDPSSRLVELDLNPVIAGPEGAVAVDCAAVVAE